MSPKMSSIGINFLLKKKGSISDVNRAPVLIETKATETFETLIAEKKKIQCDAIKIPPIINFTIFFGDIFKGNLVNNKYIKTNKVASSILYQTNGMASMVISAPKIAVNPQIKTSKWRWR